MFNKLREKLFKHSWNILQIIILFKLFRFDPFHNLLYCENYKIASSTWATHLFSMSMISLPRRIHLAALQKFSLSAQHITGSSMLENATSFLIVRDPFERILSAFTVCYKLHFFYWFCLKTNCLGQNAKRLCEETILCTFIQKYSIRDHSNITSECLPKF